jgi:predicted RNA-binding protein
MCLAKACIRENGEEELVMEGVTLMKIENERLILNSIFSEQKEIEAHVKEIDFLHHSITLGRTRPVEVIK